MILTDVWKEIKPETDVFTDSLWSFWSMCTSMVGILPSIWPQGLHTVMTKMPPWFTSPSLAITGEPGKRHDVH